MQKNYADNPIVRYTKTSISSCDIVDPLTTLKNEYRSMNHIFNQPDKILTLSTGVGPFVILKSSPKIKLHNHTSLITKLFTKHGIKEKNIHIIYLIPWSIPHDKIPTITDIDTFKPMLHKYLNIIKPTHILTIGSAATRALLGDNNISIIKLRGKTHIWNTYTTVIPTLDPSFILRNNTYLSKLSEDIKLFISLCNNT